MGTKPTKALDNVFCRARLEAAKYNDRLKSREGAAELLGYASSSTISDWELGLTYPPPEAVLKMADLYNAPELMNHYCRSLCPLGHDLPECKVRNLDRLTIEYFNAVEIVEKAKDALLSIALDGVVDSTEQEEFDQIIEDLSTIEKLAKEFRIYAKKNRKED